jgi:hypothetical protein
MDIFLSINNFKLKIFDIIDGGLVESYSDKNHISHFNQKLFNNFFVIGYLFSIF